MRVDDEAVTERVLDRRTYLRATGLTALGSGETATASMPETILVEADDTVRYEFDVSGDIIPVPTGTDVWDAVGDGTVTGLVSDGVAAYHVTGEVSDIRIDGGGRVESGQTARDLLRTPAHVLAVSAPAETTYELRTSGPIEPLDGVATDTVSREQEGGWTVRASGPNAFALEGAIHEFDSGDETVSLELDGEEQPRCAFTAGDEPRRQELLVTSPKTVQYEFTATAGIQHTSVGSPASTGDTTTVSHNDDGTWTATGTVANGFCDTFTVYGDLTAFVPKCGDFTVLVDGEPITPRAALGPEFGGHTGSLGGGDGYTNPSSARAATTQVSSATDLQDALDGATPGDTVFIAGDADIDVGTTTLDVSEGVTLASNRGIDAAPGGLVRTTEATWPTLRVHDDARVAGLRLGGPQETFVSYDGDRVGLGIDVVGSGVEIDNCELFGFASAAVRCGADTHIHHSYLHHIPMDLVGSAIRCTDGQPRIQYNYINYARNGVTATGTGGYTVAYNRFGADVLDHALACDEPGGTALEIHHNTVASTASPADDQSAAVALHGEPSEGAIIANNWFHTEAGPSAAPADGADIAVTQSSSDSWQNVEFADNHYGSEDPSRNIGHPR